MTDAAAGNLLVALHRWAPRQDENYTTEAFAHLLRHYVAHEPKAAAAVLSRLTNGFFSTELNPDAIVVTTQPQVAGGRPDIEIRSEGRWALVEVKTISGLGLNQLSAYRRAMGGSDGKARLVLLAGKVQDEPNEKKEKPDVSVRWHEVAETLRSLAEKDDWRQNEESRCLTEQFIEYLKERGLTMERVDWELVRGLKACNHLLAMLESVLKELDVPLKAGVGRDFTGFYLERSKYWVGVYYEEPGLLEFDTQKVPIDAARAQQAGAGEVVAGNPWLRGESYWRNRLNLEAESVHFFALSKESQRKVIKQFMTNCLGLAKKMARTRGR